MSQNIVFSIIMPTYNSEKTILKSLNSINNQDFSKEQLEVLVIDGGSSDKTIKIAKSFNFVKIIDNPERIPEYAKMYGIQKAKGQYVVKMDSDEEFINNDTLSKRYKIFKENPTCHLILANQLMVPKELCYKYIASEYANAIGDPFTFFMYRPKKTIFDSFKYNIREVQGNTARFVFADDELRPIADGGTTTFDLYYLRRHSLIDTNNIHDIMSITDKILDKSKCCFCDSEDKIKHNSAVTLQSFIKKIKFRVVNNVFSSKDAGFSNRRVSKNKKKFLFPIYSFLLIPSFIDAIKLSVNYKSLSFMLHPLYCILTTLYIAKYMVLKVFGKNISNKEY